MTVSQLRTYQVCFFVGSNAPQQEGVQVIDVTPEEATVEAVHAAVAASGFSGADLKSRVLFFTDAQTPDMVLKALATYCELIGLSRRCVDVTFPGDSQALVIADLSRAMSKMPTVRPEGTLHSVVVNTTGVVDDSEDSVTVNISQELTVEQASAISFAKKCRLDVGADPADVFPQFVAVQALRKRGEHERLPDLSVGGEEAISGEACRRFGDMLRRSMRNDDRTHVVPPAELTTRQLSLSRAAATPVRATLAALGASSVVVDKVDQDGNTTETEVWKCLHPENHTNGDANPSAKVLDSSDGVERFRCFRCLPEKVDSLGLAMWALDASGDEAADWIFHHVSA